MKKLAQLTLVLCVVLLFSTCATTKKEYADAVYEIDLFFYEYADWSSRPFILVEINGIEYQAAFDTGSYNGGILIPRQEIEKLGLEKTGTKKIRRVNTDWREYIIYNLPHMLIRDNLLVYDVDCRELDIEGLEAIIGMQSFKDLYNILVSYSQEKIYVWEKNYLPPFLSEWTKVPITSSNNLYVSGTVNETPYTFCLDTGYGSYYNGILIDVSLDKLDDWHNVSFTLGDRKFSTSFLYNETPNKDILGVDFYVSSIYHDYDVFIDFDGAMVYIEN